jgi:hypothetical protein
VTLPEAGQGEQAGAIDLHDDLDVLDRRRLLEQAPRILERAERERGARRAVEPPADLLIVAALAGGADHGVAEGAALLECQSRSQPARAGSCRDPASAARKVS